MEEFVQTLIWLIPVIPLLGAIFNTMFTGENSEVPVAVIGCASVALSFLCGLLAFLYLTGRSHMEPISAHLWTWMDLGSLEIAFTLYLDTLSGIMILVVTGVGFLIHLYSIGYMHDDPSFPRYYAFLNLFIALMCWLVLSGNLVMMFIGWEGVAFCSWGLIGFWFSEEVRIDAGNKAFLVNRIGDFAFLIGIFLIFWSFGDVSFQLLSDPDALADISTGTFLTLPIPLIACLFLLLGATGKSAQIPLYVWLPDAMEGPTPVSALIHAATMVTAGIYLICRLAPLFELNPAALTVVAYVGAITLLVAALFACFEMDFKKILAYSTISQLGYMFLGVGVGAYTAGMFHLITHAFFKALLFLCSGAVLHAMHNVGDIREMGGLRKKMPVTFWTFVIAAVALVGIPPFAGFWSKDEILWFTYAGKQGSMVLWLLGLSGVLLTSFYTFRLLFVAFFGSGRMEDPESVHEAGSWMTVPMMILAILSVVGGVIGLPKVVGGDVIPNYVSKLLHHSGLGHPSMAVHDHGTQLLLMGITVGVAAAGFVLAYVLYYSRSSLPVSDDRIDETILQKPFYRKFYVDEIGFYGLVRPLKSFATMVRDEFETIFLDTLVVNGSALTVRASAWIYSLVQNGNATRYIFWIWFGIALILVFMIPS